MNEKTKRQPNGVAPCVGCRELTAVEWIAEDGKRRWPLCPGCGYREGREPVTAADVERRRLGELADRIRFAGEVDDDGRPLLDPVAAGVQSLIDMAELGLLDGHR